MVASSNGYLVFTVPEMPRPRRSPVTVPLLIRCHPGKPQKYPWLGRSTHV
jgi:hypothetical protein